MATNTPISRKAAWTTGIAVAAILAGAGALSYLPAHDAVATETPMAAPRAVPVTVARVTSRDLVQWEEFSGRLEAVERVEIRSRVAGQIHSLHFREGGLVRKGDLLFAIDPAPFAAEVARAEAQVASAQSRVAFTRREHERAQQLTGSGTMPMREMDSRANAFSEAQASLRAAQAALDSARLNLGYTQIRAPISGRIGKAEVTAGNLVPAGAGAPPLATLVSVSPIYASFAADEAVVMRALNAVRDGADGRLRVERIPVRLTISSQDDSAIEGRVQMVDNMVDARSGTVRVRATFDNEDGRLMPGQFARLGLGQARTEPALLISERAVGTDQSKKFAMVVGADDKVAYREIALGSTIDGLRVVLSGLTEGERVVVSGLQRIRPGIVVSPEETTMALRPTETLARR